mgnify:CR=1 FL=1
MYIDYLEIIKDVKMRLVVGSDRKTGLVELTVSLTSVLNLYEDPVAQGLMFSLLTYKSYHCHLETFFLMCEEATIITHPVCSLKHPTSNCYIAIK